MFAEGIIKIYHDSNFQINRTYIWRLHKVVKMVVIFTYKLKIIKNVLCFTIERLA